MQDRIPHASGRRSRRGRFSLRAERGSALIEIMISAVLVVMVATAVFKSIDAASAVSGSNRSKNVATSIAQEKLDQLRAMDPDKLSNYRGLTDSKTVDNVTYKIVARADWISDSTGGKSCTSGAPGDYLKLYVSVTWPSMRTTDKPVEAQTISTQPNGTYNNDGNIAIQITDAANVGVEGIDVSVSGASNLTDTTDANGCAFFGHLAPGSYTGAFSRTGYVDMQGVNAQGGTWTVVADQTTSKQYRYDLAASANVEFRTKIGSTTYSVPGQYVTFFHTNRNLPLTVGNGTAQTSLTGGALFPFTTPYSVYAGKSHVDCAGTNAAAVATSVTLPTSTNPVIVNEPPINNLTILINGMTAAQTTTQLQTGKVGLRVRHPTANCFDTGRFVPPASVTNTAPIPVPGTSGATVVNGFPAGTLKVCADFQSGGTWRYVQTDITNSTAITGNTTSHSITIPTSGTTSNGQCPAS